MMGAQGRIAAAALLLVAAGCKSGSGAFAVNLTIVADASLGDAVIARIGSLAIDVSGAETSHRDVLVSLPFQSSRQERVTYRAGATKGQLLFDIIARSVDGGAVGYGQAVATISGSSTNVTLTLTDQVPPNDMGNTDGGDGGPPPATLSSTLVKAGAYDLFGDRASSDGSLIAVTTRDTKKTTTIVDYMGNVQFTLEDGAQPAPDNSSSHKPGFFPGDSVVYTLAPAAGSQAQPLKLWHPGLTQVVVLSMISYPIVGIAMNDDGSYLAFEDNPMMSGQKVDLKYGPRDGPLETVVTQNSYWYMLYKFAPKTGHFYCPVDSVPAGKVDILRIAKGASASTKVLICKTCARSFVITDDGTQIAGITGLTTAPDGQGKLAVIATTNNTADAMTTAATSITIDSWMKLIPNTTTMEAVAPPTTPDPQMQTGNVIEINLANSMTKVRAQDVANPGIVATSAQWVLFTYLMAPMDYSSRVTQMQPVGSTTSTTVGKDYLQIDAVDPSGAFTTTHNVMAGTASLPVIQAISSTGTQLGETAVGSFHSTFVDATHIIYMQGDELRALDLGSGQSTILDYGVGDYAYHAATKRLFYVKRGSKPAAGDGLYLATY